MARSHRRLVAALSYTAAVALATVGLVSTGAGAQSSSVPGVTDKSVKVGYIYSGTGVAASNFQGADKGFQARIDRANAAGGVNGRKIQTELVDDASSAANLTAAQDLVQNRNVFAVVNNSPFAFLAYRYLLSQGVPLIGGGYDGTYYGVKGNENIISALGNVVSSSGLTNTNITKIIKDRGGSKVAALAYGVSAASTAAAKAIQEYGAPAVGLKAVYTNTSVDFGTSDVAPLVLGIKNSGADATVLPMVSSTNIAVVQGLAQSGVQMKANLLFTGYGQDLLDSPAAATLGPNTIFYSQYVPVELKTKATKQFQADLKKYAGYTGVPSYGQYLGYITAELIVLGLEHGGKSPTRQGFIDGLHTLGTFDGAGLACKPLDISLTNYGKTAPTGCAYYMYVKDGKFVVLNKGKPVIGKTVGSPELLKQNAEGPSATTATTAAPAP
ncbi:MAG: branched-chain amino acid transport system substrate-binding protein [Actinomycetota bacterium]|jgi:branched-chain amino acid transport system substrate-binding protein|nr:branched-chain amino acid transport system substrate-binding protein [Actinomycetota bacterium]